MKIEDRRISERSTVNNLLDKPIDSVNADILGYQQIVESIIEAINAQPNNNSLTLGLDGPWGSGKSSILAMLTESLKVKPEKKEIGTVVVSFSPWLITNRTALVSAFFSQISIAIQSAEKRIPTNWTFFKKGIAKKLVSARKQLNIFSKYAAVTSTTIGAFDPTFVSVAASGGLRAIERLTDDGGKPGKTLETLKQELTEVLAIIAEADPSFRVLVLVDDLDRLDPNDALEVLRLVKAVGDFPAITYLLAYDRDALVNAIEHIAKIDTGAIYLEKILQFSFKVPPLEPFQLRNWLRVDLEQLFPDSIVYGTVHASTVLDIWAGRLLKTPRDVKRLLFSIRALWPKLQGRANLLDLIWLQMLAQKANDKEINFYSWVVGYLQSLEAVAIGGIVTGKEQDEKELFQLLKKIGWKEYDRQDEGLSFDYHHLDELLAGVTTGYLDASDTNWIHKIQNTDLQKYRDAKRLSSPWHWRLYFALDNPSHAVTDDEWDALIQAANKGTLELSEALATVLEFRSAQRRDAADQIINRASYAISSNKLAYPGRWLSAIVEQALSMDARSKSSMFGFGKLFSLNLKALSRLVFKNISGTERKETIESIFKVERLICPAASLLREQYLLSKKEGNEKNENFYFSDEELADVIKSQTAFYEALTPLKLRSLSDPYDILYAWLNITGTDNGPRKLLETAFHDDGEFLETLSSLKYVSSSSQEGVPHIPEDFLKHFVDINVTKERLKSLVDRKSNHATKAEELLSLWWAPEF